MKINSIINQPINGGKLNNPAGKTSDGFQNVLSGFIDQVKESSTTSQSITKDFIQGGNVELHEVMIASEKAKTDLMLLTEIRNKALDTYKELLRIQI